LFFLSSRGEEPLIPAFGFTSNRKEPGLGSVSAAGSFAVAVSSLHVRAAGSLLVRAAGSLNKRWMVIAGVRERVPGSRVKQELGSHHSLGLEQGREPSSHHNHHGGLFEELELADMRVVGTCSSTCKLVLQRRLIRPTNR